MKIFLDARKIGDGGIGRFIVNLLCGLNKLNFFEKNRLTLIVGEQGSKLLREEFISEEFKGNLPLTILIDKTAKYSLVEYFFLPLKYKSIISECDWFISPHYTLPFFIPNKVKKLIVVHDLIQICYPESLIHKILVPIIIKSSIRRANKVASVSMHSARKISEYFNVSVSVIPNSISESFLEKINTKDLNTDKLLVGEKKIILFIGSDRLHKRLNLFIDFFKRLSSLSNDFHAVVVSDLRQERDDLPKNLTFINSATDVELNYLLSNAYCLVSTSREEGFCLPLIEAAALELPIICTDLEYGREILGESAWYFEDGSTEDLLRVFTLMHMSEEERSDRAKMSSNIVSSYSIENQASQFIDLIS